MLGLSAALFFLLGSADDGDPSQLATSAMGAGFALSGGTMVRYFDVLERRRREGEAKHESRLKAVDETRRVVSIALEAAKTRAPELVATAANALSKHNLGHHIVRYEDAAAHLRAVVNGNDPDGGSETWIRARIDDLNLL
jgi:hypothetical protein